MTTNNAINTGLSGTTGTGSFVGSNSPVLVTPNIGVANGTSFNGFTAGSTASEQNTATSTTTIVTPANQHNNPAGLKAFGNVTNNGTITINDSNGTTSVVRNSVGTVTVTLSRAMTNSFYVPHVQLMTAGTGVADVIISSSTVFVISTYDNTFTLADLNFSYTVSGHSIT